MDTLETNSHGSEETIKNSIWNSGFLLERRVAAFLRNSGYKVITNRGY